MSPFEKLMVWVEQAGGSVVIHNKPAQQRHRGNRWVYENRTWALVSVSPFDESCGIRWGKKELHCCFGTSIGSLIHEAGHIFASRLPPNHPKCEETRFFAWEWALAKKLDIEQEWFDSMPEYGLGSHLTGPDIWAKPMTSSFGDLLPDELPIVWKYSLAFSRKFGLIGLATSPWSSDDSFPKKKLAIVKMIGYSPIMLKILLLLAALDFTVWVQIGLDQPGAEQTALLPGGYKLPGEPVVHLEEEPPEQELPQENLSWSRAEWIRSLRPRRYPWDEFDLSDSIPRPGDDPVLTSGVRVAPPA